MLRALRIAATALALFTLTSCTRVFTITAAFADGALVFEGGEVGDTTYPRCWRDFTVAAEDGQPVWAFEVSYGAFEGEDACGPHFPLAYGQAPPRAEATIAATRIQPGRLYVITGSAGGILEGAFRISRSGDTLTIENVDTEATEVIEARERLWAWERKHDTMGTGRILGENSDHEPLEHPPVEVPKNETAGPAGNDEYTWLLNTSDRASFPSLSYSSLDERQIRFNLWCRWRGAVILGRLPNQNRRGSPLQLSSGDHQLSTSLDLLREPQDGFPIGGVLAENDPVLRTFGETGELTLRLGGEALVMNAVDNRERQKVRRFFELCYMERPDEPTLPWRQP